MSSASLIPLEVTPRQKEHASKPLNQTGDPPLCRGIFTIGVHPRVIDPIAQAEFAQLGAVNSAGCAANCRDETEGGVAQAFELHALPHPLAPSTRTFTAGSLPSPGSLTGSLPGSVIRPDRPFLHHEVWN